MTSHKVLVILLSTIWLLCITSSIGERVVSVEKGTRQNNGALGNMNSTSTKEMRSTAREVHHKLSQLHSLIDNLQMKVKSLEDGGPDQQSAIESTNTMQKKFLKLSEVITQLSGENMKLYKQNRRLKQQNMKLIENLKHLEGKFQRMNDNKGTNSSSSITALTSSPVTSKNIEKWIKETMKEIKTMLNENGLEHYLSPKFSPIIAGIVSNGILIIPLSITLICLFQYIKKLNIHNMILLINIFDIGILVSIILNSLLLLDDPLQGLRHISEINFIFIQFILMFVFWMHMIFLCLAIIQNYQVNTIWKCYLGEMVLKFIIGMKYNQHVWIPVMDHDDVSIALSPFWYVFYCFTAIINVVLTSHVHRYSLRLGHNKKCSSGHVDVGHGTYYDDVEDIDKSVGYQKMVVMNSGDCIMPSRNRV